LVHLHDMYTKSSYTQNMLLISSKQISMFVNEMKSDKHGGELQLKQWHLLINTNRTT
jgi:hypothetical protein